MKYRIKQIDYYDGSKYYIQYALLGLFWATYGDEYSCAEYSTLEDAQKAITRFKHNDNAKTTYHEA